MQHSVVDGSKNNQFHRLDRGSVNLSGTHRVYWSGPGAYATPLQLHYTLCNKTSGNCFGTVRGTPLASGARSSVNGTFTGLGGGTNYYMVIYRDGNDGHYIEGFGTLSNQ